MRYIKQWCDDAVSYIRFPPDRPAVRQELFEHMEEKYDEYVHEGMLLADAERRVIKEMGDYRETGLLLRQIHKPYLGWLWRLTQWVLVIVLIVAVVNGVKWGRNLWYSEETYDTYNPFESTFYEYEDGDYMERVLYLEPDSSVRCNGYIFTVDKVACWEGEFNTPNAGVQDQSRFYIRLNVANFRPWAEETEAPRWFSAVDSQGIVCCPYYEYIYSEMLAEPYVRGNRHHSAPFTYTWELRLENYVYRDAEWIELRYDRGGKEFSIRIDLTGGEGS